MSIDTYWQLINQIDAAVLILDSNGDVQFANQDLLNLFELNSEEQIQGKNLGDFLSNEGKEYLKTLYQAEFFDENVNLDDTISFDDGTSRKISLTAKQLPDESGFLPGSIWTIKESLDDKLPGATLEHKKKLEDLEWLADQGRELLSISHWSDILDISGQALQEKLGDCIVVTLTKPDEDHLKMEGVYGIKGKLISKVFDLVGINAGILLPIDKRFLDTYSKRQLYHHTASFEDFASSFVPPKISRQVENMLGITGIYTIGLEGNQRVMGCFYIFKLDSDLEINHDLIESFTFQVALALEKLKFARDLKESQEKFLTVYEYAPDAYYISDLQGNFLDGNLAAEKITGYSKDELIGTNFLRAGLLSKDQIIKAGNLVAQNLLGKSTGPDEFLLIQKEGTSVPVEIATHPVKIGEDTVVLGIARDISSRKKAEDDLDTAHSTLTRVLEGIDAHVYVADMESYNILYMNKKMIEDYGGNFTGKKCYKVFRGEDRICAHCSNAKLIDHRGEPGDVYIWEGQNTMAQKWYRNYDRAMLWTDQQLVRMQIAVDITDSKENQLSLKQSEERYRTLFEKSHNAIMTVSPPDWNFTSGNSAMIQMFRLKDENHFLELQPWELSPEYQPDGEKSKDKAKVMIQTAVDKGSNFFDWTHKRWDGEEFTATVQLTRVDLEEDFFIQATVRDISERVKAEEQLLRQMDDLALLNDLNVSANQGKSLNEILAQVSNDTARLFSSKTTTVYLLSDDDNYLHVNLQYLDNSLLSQVEKLTGISWPEYIEIPIREDGLFQKLLDSGEAKILSSKEEIFELVNEYLTSTFLTEKVKIGLKKLIPNIYKLTGIKSLIVAPLISAGKPIGFIDMSSSGIFSNDEMRRFKSFADQLCGFIQKINAEDERKRSITELEFINQAITGGSRIEDIDEICGHLAKAVKKINPDAYLVVSLYDHDQESIRVRAVEGLGKFGDQLFKRFGGRPEEFQIETNEYSLDDKLNALYTSGKLERIPGGLFDLTRGKISERLCKSIERMTGVSEVYIAGFGLQGKSTGGLVLFLNKDTQIQFPDAIEAVVSHYSMIFERRFAQQDVIKRKTQLEALREIEHDLTNELDIDILLQSISERTRSIVSASACGFSVYNPDRQVLEYKAYSGFEELPENTDVYPGEGLSGMVFIQKETLIVKDYSAWENRVEDWVPVSNYYLAGIPVSWGEEMLGVLEVALDPGESLSPSELSTLELFAAQAAIAIKNAQLYSDEKRRRMEAETLREVGLLINQMIDHPNLLDRVLLSLQKVVPYTSASIQLVDGQDVVVEAYQGKQNQFKILGTRYRIDEDIAAKRIIQDGKIIILNNKDEVEGVLKNNGSGSIVSWMAVPLESQGKRIGILTLDHTLPDRYSTQDALLVVAFASQVVVALENNRLLNETRRRTKEIEAVYDSALSLTKELQPEVLFEDLYKQIEPLFKPDAYILAIHDNSLDMIRVAYATEAGIRQRQTEGMLISPEEKNSLLGWIVRKRSALLIGNVEKDSLPFQPKQEGKIIRSFLGVPLLIGDRVCGALVVQSYQADSYTKDHQRLLQLLGNQVAIALENSRLFDDAQRRLSRISSLHDIEQAISGSVDLRMTMDVLINQLRHTLEVDAACVLSYNKTTKTLEYVNAKGFRTPSLQYTSLKIGDGLAGKAAIERDLVHILDLNVEETSFQQSPQFSQEGFISYMAQPLIAKGELVGVLEVFHRNKLTPDPEWFRFLDSLSRSAAIAIDRLNLLNSLTQSNIDLKQAYEATIEGWARAVELRDGETEGHSRRVVALTMNLARKMGISGEELSHIRRGALLHDIGKMAIPDGILMKAGKLTDEEWLVMKKHPIYANEMLSKIDYLKSALDIPHYHHERWDGSGYPHGLAEDAIPFQARLFAVVDVWDALQSDRPYRKSWTEKQAVQYLKDQAGKEFDPKMVNEFLDLIGKS